MSFHVLNWAWLQQDLTPAEKIVLVRLADQTNDEGVCWPGMKYLSQLCSLSQRHVVRVILSLENKKLIDIHRKTNNGVKKNNEYSLMAPVLQLKPSPKKAKKINSDMVSVGSDMVSVGGSDMVSHKPSEENHHLTVRSGGGIKSIAQIRKEQTPQEREKRIKLLRQQAAALKQQAE